MNENCIRKQVTEYIRWENVPTGTEFRAIYNENPISGLIFNNVDDKKIILCQDFAQGSDAPNNLGYKFGFTLNYNTIRTVAELEFGGYGSMRNIEILDVQEGFVTPDLPIRIGDYKLEIKEGHIKVGCTTIDNDLVRKIADNLIDKKD
jgi:hypothetical protein